MPRPVTLLIDLDDTLLVNPVQDFMREYLKLLSEHLSSFIPPQVLIPQLLKSTDLMIEKHQPYQTLEQVFDDDFYPALRVHKKEIIAEINRFYIDIFPKLRTVTSPRPEAIKAIDYAFSHGFQVVVATNPLFPRMATLHRLEWAGLPVSDYPFDLITTYESMHYAKPNTAYYAEILAQLGWPEQPVCMVGNSVEFDILPSNRLGIPGFLVMGDQTPGNFEIPKGTKVGSLDELIPWFESVATWNSKVNANRLETDLVTLYSTPCALVEMTRDFSLSQWKAGQGEGKKDYDTIASEIAGLEKIRLDSLLSFLHMDFDQSKTYQTYTLCQDEIIRNALVPNTALIEFFYNRSVVLELLEGVSKSAWNEMIEHPKYGCQTLYKFIKVAADEDRTMLRQVKTQNHRS